jgi:hypothetical protein
MTIKNDGVVNEKRNPRSDELSERVDRQLAAVNSTFIKCPKCQLPTHSDHDGSTTYCASCREYFSVTGGETRDQKLEKLTRKTSRKSKIIAASLVLIIVLVIASFILAYFLTYKESTFIGIEDVNDIRVLPIAEEIPRSSISSEELDEMLNEPLDSEDREWIQELEWIYKSLFIIPESWNLLDIYENGSSGAGIAGFYDPEDEKMYIVGEIHSEEYVNYILAHEYTHALQDQNFDLEEYMDRESFDVDFARLCSIEGDATLTMEKWSDENLDELDKRIIELEGTIQVLSSIDFTGREGYSNEVLSEMAYFPYDGGLEFVKNVYDDGGYEAVNQLFTTKPPLSSEQVLHYEKYLEYEKPDNVSFFGDVSGLTLEFSTTVGEKILSEMLIYNEGSSEDWMSTARGWGGDRMLGYSSGDDFLTVLVTQWDSTDANGDFSTSYDRMIDSIGFEEDEFYKIRGNYLLKDSTEDRTVIYYSSSQELIEASMEE